MKQGLGSLPRRGSHSLDSICRGRRRCWWRRCGARCTGAERPARWGDLRLVSQRNRGHEGNVTSQPWQQRDRECAQREAPAPVRVGLPVNARRAASRMTTDAHREREQRQRLDRDRVLGREEPLHVEHLGAVRDRGLVVVLGQQPIAAQPIGDGQQHEQRPHRPDRQRRGQPAEEEDDAGPSPPGARVRGWRRARWRPRPQAGTGRRGSPCRAWSRSPADRTRRSRCRCRRPGRPGPSPCRSGAAGSRGSAPRRSSRRAARRRGRARARAAWPYGQGRGRTPAPPPPPRSPGRRSRTGSPRSRSSSRRRPRSRGSRAASSSSAGSRAGRAGRTRARPARGRSLATTAATGRGPAEAGAPGARGARAPSAGRAGAIVTARRAPARVGHRGSGRARPAATSRPPAPAPRSRRGCRR